MADKEPAGSPDEPTPADDFVEPASSAPVSPADRSDEAGSGTEPSNEELAAADEAAGNGESNGEGATATDRQPVTVGAASAGSKRGAAKAARSESDQASAKSDAKAGKGRVTRKRDGAAPPKKRTGPVSFVRESVAELRKVVYPTGQQLVNYFVVVLIFVLFVIAYVSLLDLGFGWAMFQIFA